MTKPLFEINPRAQQIAHLGNPLINNALIKRNANRTIQRYN